MTVFGESAGAGMVANLMTIPSAKGLFVRALGELSPAGGEKSEWKQSGAHRLVSLTAS